MGLVFPIGLHLLLGDGVHFGQVTDQGLGLEEARGADHLSLLPTGVLDLGLPDFCFKCGIIGENKGVHETRKPE